ncbi:FecCD family ABC transporter permease [Kytococcus sedentarius]|uniref:FecCD family ABC transporter permease n=1 Tax=Kytococcus sedentarius TaxID=1276 RepID=UPI0035BC0B20
MSSHVASLGHGRRLALLLGLGLAAVAAACLASLAIGATVVPLGTVWQVLTDAAGNGIVEARIDRTVLGAIVGASMGCAGAAMQALTRNPLADPGILGVNAGAALAIVLGLATGLLTAQSQYVWFALAGAAVATTLVYGIASMGPGGAQPVTLTIAGAAFAATATSLGAGLLVVDLAALDVFRVWQVGTVAGRDLGLVASVAPVLLVGFALTLPAGGFLNTLGLGDDLARGLGQRVWLVRLVVALGAVCLCAAGTALAGPVAFVGLVVPHLVRLLTGPDARRVMLGSALFGAALVVGADTLGRVVLPPTEVQVGIMTAVIGAPALIALVRTRRVTA